MLGSLGKLLGRGIHDIAGAAHNVEQTVRHPSNIPTSLLQLLNGPGAGPSPLPPGTVPRAPVDPPTPPVFMPNIPKFIPTIDPSNLIRFTDGSIDGRYTQGNDTYYEPPGNFKIAPYVPKFNYLPRPQ